MTDGVGVGQDPSLALETKGSNVHTVEGTPTVIRDTGKEARTMDLVPTRGLVVSEMTIA